MKHTHKTFAYTALLAGLVLLAQGCKKSILDENEESTLTADNVRIKVFPYVNGYLYNPDSLYFLGGANLKIDEIEIVHSNFYFVDQGDTLPAGDPDVWKLSTGNDVYLYQLPPGSYSGFYRYLIGLNSVTNAKAPADQPETSILRDGKLYRGSGKGYNFVVITGRIQDPDKPNAEPSIPLKWQIATDDLTSEFGMAKSFNLVTGKAVTFDVILQIEMLFNGLAPLATPTISSDPANANDMQKANALKDNFLQAYKLQL